MLEDEVMRGGSVLIRDRERYDVNALALWIMSQEGC